MMGTISFGTGCFRTPAARCLLYNNFEAISTERSPQLMMRRMRRPSHANPSSTMSG